MQNRLNLEIPEVQNNIKLPQIIIKFPKNIEYKTTFNPWLNVGILQINDILFNAFENFSAKIRKQDF